MDAFEAPTDPPIRGFLHEPVPGRGSDSSRPTLILTHGAGANCQSPLLIALADSFSGAGFSVLRCDLPFRQQRPNGPPLGSAARDQAGLHRAVEAMRSLNSGHGGGPPVFLGGHSYGGRMATLVAAAEPGLADGLLLLSYPLHPPRKPDQLRTQHFPQLRTPALFVHGMRDPFGSIEEMTASVVLIPARTQLLPVEGAGHELLTRANRETLPTRIAEVFSAFALS